MKTPSYSVALLVLLDCSIDLKIQVLTKPEIVMHENKHAEFTGKLCCGIVRDDVSNGL